MKGLWIALGVVGVFVVVLFFGFMSYVSSKNQMVKLNEDVNESYSQMDVVLQRRLDLIPNLVASVKGYVKEEETVLTNIANARAGVIAAGSDHASAIDANKRLDVAISPLLRLQETYPNLRGNEQFIRLEDELAGTENRIATERRRYNLTLESYNVYVQQFPNSVWRGWLDTRCGTSITKRMRRRRRRLRWTSANRLQFVDARGPGFAPGPFCCDPGAAAAAGARSLRG